MIEISFFGKKQEGSYGFRVFPPSAVSENGGTRNVCRPKVSLFSPPPSSLSQSYSGAINVIATHGFNARSS